MAAYRLILAEQKPARGTILLIPGFLAGIPHFEALGAVLAGRGYNVIIVERGNGRRRVLHLDWQYADDIASSLAAVYTKTSLTPTIIVAHSYGMIAAEAFIKRYADTEATEWLPRATLIGLAPAGLMGKARFVDQAIRFYLSIRHEQVGFDQEEPDLDRFLYKLSQAEFRRRPDLASSEGLQVLRHPVDLRYLHQKVQTIRLIAFPGDRLFPPSRIQHWFDLTDVKDPIIITDSKLKLTHNSPVYSPSAVASIILDTL